MKNAIEIGRLLTERKAELAHGEWIPWVERYLTFNPRQAQKYMRAYAHRSSHLLDSATSINEAVALLAEPKDQPVEDQDDGPDIDTEPWFAASDVAKALGYSDPHVAIRSHCKGVVKTTTPSRGGDQTMKIIPEHVVYRLIMRSELPQDERFEEVVWKNPATVSCWAEKTFRKVQEAKATSELPTTL